MEPQQSKVASIITPLKKVTPLSKYLAMALFVILPFLGGYVGYILALEKVAERVVSESLPVNLEPNNSQSEDSNTGSDITIRGDTNENFIRYVDENIGIAFNYPAHWGKVAVKDEGGDCPENYREDACNFRALILEDTDDSAIFLSAETKGHQDYPIGRGAFWGDMAGLIGPDYLTLCTEQNNCSILKNSKGVSFALYKADPPPEEYGYMPERYYIYNPDSKYFGLVLSAHRLSQTPDSDRLFKEVVIDSFEFIKP